MNLDDDVVPGVVRVARERLSLGVREVDDRAELRAGAVTGEPTTSDGSTRTCETETTSDGATVGWMSMRDPYVRPFSETSSIATIVPSTGEYTSVPGGSADVDRRRAGPAPPGSWYQRGRPTSRRSPSARARFSKPWFACVPTGASASAPSVPPW